MRQILPFAIPVDDQWHTYSFSGPVVHVGCEYGQYDTVMLWAMDGGLFPPQEHSFCVFDTLQPIPDDARYVGTALALSRSGEFAWHVCERITNN